MLLLNDDNTSPVPGGSLITDSAPWTPSPMTRLGNREDLARVYHAAKDLIVKHKVLRICQMDVTGETVRLTICNLWRLEREKDGLLRLLEFDLQTAEWRPATDFDRWPSIPLWPISRAQDPGYAEGVLRTALWRCLDAAGIKSLPKIPPGAIDADSLPIDERTDFLWSPKKRRKSSVIRYMTPNRMGRLLIEHYLGRTVRNTYKPGFVSRESIHAGGRALRAAFHEHIRDKALFSIAIAIDYERVPFTFYLLLEQHRDAVLRIARENRNLLPLLNVIRPSQWGRPDLFSRKLWVRGERKTTLVDRTGFERVFYQKKRLGSFTQPRDWRWLHRAPTSLVQAWCAKGQCNRRVIAAFAEANVSLRVPIVALRGLVYEVANNDHRGLLDAMEISRLAALFRLYLLHAAKLWKEEGHNRVKAWVYTTNLSPLCDYLAAEGFALGFPHRNATWASLQDRSNDWHERIRIAAIQKDEAEQKAAAWTSILPCTVINGVTFTPLTTGYALAVEGYEQHHCVGSYTHDCLVGHSRIFSVQDAAGTRSTLQLRLRGKSVTIGQHYEARNQRVKSSATRRAATELGKQYRKALKAVLIAKDGNTPPSPST